MTDMMPHMALARSMVNLEFRHGTKPLPLVNAMMTSPRLERDLLMLAPSFSRDALTEAPRSLPARSKKVRVLRVEAPLLSLSLTAVASVAGQQAGRRRDRRAWKATCAAVQAQHGRVRSDSMPWRHWRSRSAHEVRVAHEG